MNNKVFDDILDLNEQVDKNGRIIYLKKENREIFKEIDEPILLCDLVDNQKEEYNLNVKTILQKLNRSKINKENELRDNDVLFCGQNSLYENFLTNKTKIDDNLKTMINDLSFASAEQSDISEKSLESKNFSIFSSEEDIFQSIFRQIKILFLKPIMDFSFSTLNEDSKINLDLLDYIDFYILSNMEFFIDSFSGEFFVFFLGEGGDYITYNNIKESKNYMLFIKQAYQKFESLSMFHFRFLDAKIEFFNSCLKNLIFLVLQVNFFASNTINQDKIKNFLEKFFEKIFQKKIENNNEF